MKNWLKKYWWIVAAITTIIIYVGIDVAENFNYKSKIRQLNKDIAEKEDRIKESEKREEALWQGIERRDKALLERDEKLKKKDEEIAGIRKERDSWKGKVEEMTPSEVVVETRKVLNVKNIFERADGVLFSLECARVNLRALRTGEFSLAAVEVDKLNEKIADMTANGLMKDNQIQDLKSIALLKDKQILGLKSVIKDWKEAFDLSEKRGKKMRRKGRKEGTIIGGIIGGLIGFFLGK